MGHMGRPSLAHAGCDLEETALYTVQAGCWGLSWQKYPLQAGILKRPPTQNKTNPAKQGHDGPYQNSVWQASSSLLERPSPSEHSMTSLVPWVAEGVLRRMANTNST